jgi:AraC-like DNA-binding protein
MAEVILSSVTLSLLEDLFDCLPASPFFIKDRSLRYVAANTAMLRLCGVSKRSEILGKTAAHFFPDRLRRHYESLDRQILETGKPVRDKLEPSLSMVKSATWLLFSRFPVRAADGAIVGVAANSRMLGPADFDHPVYARFAAVLDHIRDHFGDPLDLAALADRAGISPSQLERDFRRLLDMTPHQFLSRIRIERAQTYLDEGRSVTETAHLCGYADHSAFTRKFREMTGHTPSGRPTRDAV